MNDKQISEMKHRMMHKFLVANLPKCNIKYDGEVGVDHTITFGDRVTIAETKTCRRVKNNGLKRRTGSPVIGNKATLGRFSFNRAQHEQLIREDGWYLFMVGTSVKFGIKAKEVEFKSKGQYYTISWLNIISKCYPNWLRYFKTDVYGV